MRHNHYLAGFLLIVMLVTGFTLRAQPSGYLLSANSLPGPSRSPSPSQLNPDNWTGIRSPYYQEMIALTTVSGTVQQLTANEDDVLDGFTLSTDSATITIHFPPHLGQSIRSAAKPGTLVSVTGFAETGPDGQSHFQLTQLTTGNAVISDTPPAQPLPQVAPALTSLKGKVVAYRSDNEGRTSGLILSDQTLVRIPLLLAGQLVRMIPTGSTIAVNGYVQQPAEGHVRLHTHIIMQASVLTINGQSYLIR
jgi:hypothetical protein